MYQRWGRLPSYQRTRGALQFLATVVHALWERRGEGEVQGLIGPGDVGLGDEDVRASFFEQVGQTNQYAAAVEADFLAADAGTRIIDERVGSGSPALRRLRVGTRVATSIALLSFGAREGEERGALEREVLEATLVPGLDANLIRSALRDLRAETLLYLHYPAGATASKPRPTSTSSSPTRRQSSRATRCSPTCAVASSVPWPARPRERSRCGRATPRRSPIAYRASSSPTCP
jgi:hypothetical protein